jgi:predicted dehydrogenase
MILKFRKGTIANLVIDMLRPKYERYCHVIADHGDITWQFVPTIGSWKDYNSKANSIVTERSVNSNSVKQKNFQDNLNQMYVDEVKNFLASILHDKNSFVSGWEGLKTLKIGLAALKSAATNKPVRV